MMCVIAVPRSPAPARAMAPPPSVRVGADRLVYNATHPGHAPLRRAASHARPMNSPVVTDRRTRPAAGGVPVRLAGSAP